MSSGSNRTSSAQPSISILSEGVVDTNRIGLALATALQPGDLVCISGPLGAGKSELCRAIIRALLGSETIEVPSPSYTLVNVYDHPTHEIWHADLYRIGDESELEEIGLEDAIETSIVLVEWPERWPELPGRRLEIDIRPSEQDIREFMITGIGKAWEKTVQSLKVRR